MLKIQGVLQKHETLMTTYRILSDFLEQLKQMFVIVVRVIMRVPY